MGVLRLTAEREFPTCDEPLGYRRGVVFRNAIFIALLAVVTVSGTFTTGLAQEPEATVELRVWQRVSDPLQVFLSEWVAPIEAGWRHANLAPAQGSVHVLAYHLQARPWRSYLPRTLASPRLGRVM